MPLDSVVASAAVVVSSVGIGLSATLADGLDSAERIGGMSAPVVLAFFALVMLAGLIWLYVSGARERAEDKRVLYRLIEDHNRTSTTLAEVIRQNTAVAVEVKDAVHNCRVAQSIIGGGPRP